MFHVILDANESTKKAFITGRLLTLFGALYLSHLILVCIDGVIVP